MNIRKDAIQCDNELGFQRLEFERNGFISFPKFLDSREVSELHENVERFKEQIVPSMPREHVFYEDINDCTSLKQLQQMYAYDDYFHQLMFGSKFEVLASTLLGGDVRGVNMQYFNKPAGIGQPTPPHQDGYYFMLEPNEAVTMWLALDDVDEENGCVRYVTGSHKNGLQPHGATGTLGFSKELLEYSADNRKNEIACRARPGDLLVHHALTIHRADGNQSRNRSRQSLGLIYYSVAAVESREKAIQQQALMEKLKSAGKI